MDLGFWFFFHQDCRTVKKDTQHRHMPHLRGLRSMHTFSKMSLRNWGELSCTTWWIRRRAFRYSRKRFMKPIKCSAVRMLPGTASAVTEHDTKNAFISSIKEAHLLGKYNIYIQCLHFLYTIGPNFCGPKTIAPHLTIGCMRNGKHITKKWGHHSSSAPAGWLQYNF